MSLLSMSVQAGVMIAVITIIRALAINRLPKKTFLALWGIVLLRLLVPFSFPSPFSVYSLANRTGITLPATGAPVVNFSQFVAPPQTVAPAAPSISIWALLWGIGVALCALYFVLAYVRCHKEFMVSQVVENDFAANWLTEHTLKRPIQIRQSSFISAPLTYGIFRPVILMPKQTDWTDSKTLRVVLAHEYTHIRRFDAFTKILFTAALCVHWSNPLVWAMFILANRDIELSCDEAVVYSFGETIKSAYALALIRMEERKSTLTPFCNSFSKNAIEERIKAIMKTKKASTFSKITAFILLAGLTVGFATTEQAMTQNSQDFSKTEMELVAVGQEEYFSIVSEEDLFAVGSEKFPLSANYILNSDIVLTHPWVPIGNKAVPFTGDFNGNGYTIHDVYFDQKPENIGFFGYVKDANIQNVSLQGFHNEFSTFLPMCGVAYNSIIENINIADRPFQGK